MANSVYVAAATSKIVTIEGFTQSDGSEYTGAVFNTATITAKYCRDNGTETSITLVTMTPGTWVSGGFVHRSSGVYELGLPNAALVAGADGVEIKVAGITGKYFKPVRLEITGVDPRSSTAPDVNVTKVNSTTQTAGDLAALIATGTSYVDTEVGALTTSVAAIKAKTDNLPSDPADASDVSALIAAVSAKVDTVDDFLDTEMPALTVSVAAIKAKTDSLTFTKALELDANVQSINGVTINGAGVLANEFQP